jgi:hypothetical protein
MRTIFRQTNIEFATPLLNDASALKKNCYRRMTSLRCGRLSAAHYSQELNQRPVDEPPVPPDVELPEEFPAPMPPPLLESLVGLPPGPPEPAPVDWAKALLAMASAKAEVSAIAAIFVFIA